MATMRVVEYFHTPGVPKGCIDFVLHRARLRGIDMEIAQNYIEAPELDTAGYAQLVHMDRHVFSRHSANVFRAIMRVMIQMVVELWEEKYKQ